MSQRTFYAYTAATPEWPELVKIAQQEFFNNAKLADPMLFAKVFAHFQRLIHEGKMTQRETVESLQFLATHKDRLPMRTIAKQLRDDEPRETEEGEPA